MAFTGVTNAHGPMENCIYLNYRTVIYDRRVFTALYFFPILDNF